MNAANAIRHAMSLVRNDFATRYIVQRRPRHYAVIPRHVIKEYHDDARMLRVIWSSGAGELLIREYHAGFLAEALGPQPAVAPTVPITVPIKVSQPRRQLRKIHLGKENR